MIHPAVRLHLSLPPFDGGRSWGLSCLEPQWEACVPVTTDSAQLDKTWPGQGLCSSFCGSSQGLRLLLALLHIGSPETGPCLGTQTGPPTEPWNTHGQSEHRVTPASGPF